MLDIGHYQELRVAERTQHGLVLTDGEERVLLPNKYAPKSAKSGDALRVFVYTDSDDLPIATTQSPKASVGEFAFLKVVGGNRTRSVPRLGARQGPVRSQERAA
jgi:hypothetical protein